MFNIDKTALLTMLRQAIDDSANADCEHLAHFWSENQQLYCGTICRNIYARLRLCPGAGISPRCVLARGLRQLLASHGKSVSLDFDANQLGVSIGASRVDLRLDVPVEISPLIAAEIQYDTAATVALPDDAIHALKAVIPYRSTERYRPEYHNAYLFCRNAMTFVVASYGGFAAFRRVSDLPTRFGSDYIPFSEEMVKMMAASDNVLSWQAGVLQLESPGIRLRRRVNPPIGEFKPVFVLDHPFVISTVMLRHDLSRALDFLSVEDEHAASRFSFDFSTSTVKISGDAKTQSSCKIHLRKVAVPDGMTAFVWTGFQIKLQQAMKFLKADEIVVGFAKDSADCPVRIQSLDGREICFAAAKQPSKVVYPNKTKET